MLVRSWEPSWRWLFNAPDARAHRRAAPALNEVARQLLIDFNRDGVASCDVGELTGDPTLLGRLQAEARALELEHSAQAAAGSATLTSSKSFLIQLLGNQPVVDPRGTMVQLALHPQLKGVVDSYFGLKTRLSDVNVWRNLTQDGPPSSSQLWHRDIPDDRFVVKVFLYLEDCDEGGGPFSYIPGTHTKGNRSLAADPEHVLQERPVPRVDDEGMAAVIPRDQWRINTGRAGTLLLADTNGYHKGGLARTSSRLLLQGLYTSRAGRRKYVLRLVPGTDPAEWSDELLLADA
ncbi:MAG: hypothetical protein JWL64_2130 [Frankiales bacterium]|nr:hypothetical protein [Frankiales bacterium]